MSKPCLFCGKSMPSNMNIYCKACSQERQRLALIHFYGCPHLRPIDTSKIGVDKFFWRTNDDHECPECQRLAYPHIAEYKVRLKLIFQKADSIIKDEKIMNDNEQPTAQIINSSPCPSCECTAWEVDGDHEQTLGDERVTVVEVHCVNCGYEREWIED